MSEHQGVEWKEIWKDEYLKWICGYANAQGGTLIIGKDDNGEVKGIRNAKKLLEDIPNKIVSTMNIIADVNLIEENEKAPYPNIDTNSRGVMVLCKPCEKYKRLLSEKYGKDTLPNMQLQKLSQEEQVRMASILKYLDDNSIITNAIGRDLLGKSVATTKRYLNRLCEVGILKQKGAGRSSYYERR